MAGYRNKTSLFVPDGAAVKDQGPNIKTYTMGLSLQMEMIQFDLAYEFRNMTYYDSYFSNTNYNSQTYSNILMGFTFNL
jgi:hypothetical protein